MIRRTDHHVFQLSQQRGFYLLEVLVSLLVLAIGLLGIAALQAQGLRNSQDAYTRSQATLMAYDIIDRMRANRDNLALYVLDPYAGEAVACDPTLSTVADSDDKVKSELRCWHDAVANALPGGRACIQISGGDSDDCDEDVPGAGDNLFDITIRWVDRGAYVGDSDEQVEIAQTWTVWP